MAKDGLVYEKYNVSRVDGRDAPGEGKANAQYFVLDYVNDWYARIALGCYADSCSIEFPELAADIEQKLADSKGKYYNG